jgi:hypothetical protein
MAFGESPLAYSQKIRRTMAACSLSNLTLARRQALVGERADDAIAVRVAATGLAGLDASSKPASSLVGEVLKEQGIHRALDPT